MSTSNLVGSTSIAIRGSASRQSGDAASYYSLGWVCTFLSTLVLLMGAVIGSAGAAGFLLVWVLYVALRPDHLIRSLPLLGILWALPALTLLSTFWSEATVLTARSSVQYTLTILCAVLAAQATPARQFISAIMIALLAIALLSLAAGRVSVDPMTGEQAYLGIFASKNYLASFITLLLMSAMAVIVDRHQPALMRLLAAVSFLPALPLLILTRSATSLVVAAACIGLLATAFVFTRMTPKWRAVFLIVSIFAVLYVLAILLLTPQAYEYFITRVLGKSTTLTGRTYLWARAAGIISQDPIIGQGFQAFWRHDSLEAEALWMYFGITNRGGFHFHNTYIETLVGLGNTGLIILVGTLLIVVGRVLASFLQTISVPSAYFLTVLASIVIRSFVEIDILYQFQLLTFVFFAMAIYSLPEMRVRQ
jgi:exopolysaccharide production protein ExoQ